MFFLLAVITFFQYLEFGKVSILGLANLYLKFFCGGFVFDYCKEKFALVFFEIVYYLSFISLFGFCLINIWELNLPYFQLDEINKSYLVYGTSFDFHLKRNAGMFWEPGAFSGVITICLIFNYLSARKIWMRDKFKFSIILLALLLTQSSTGYLILFILLIFYFSNLNNLSISLILSSMVAVFVGWFFQSLEFLSLKLSDQFLATFDQRVGEFSNTRVGSFIFDWYYISKHPLIGNGIISETRFSDHISFFGSGFENEIGSGNGLSNIWASWGLIVLSAYLFLIWESAKNYGLKYQMLFLVVILFNLVGEQWQNFPLFLGIPFVSHFHNKSSNY
jgi:hypothetical protein